MSVDNPGDPAPTDQLVVHRKDVEQLTVYSWMREGHMNSAWPGDGKEVPPDGAEIKLRIIAFPGGSVREIWLDKETRTHPHGSYEAVLFYQIDGRRVQMVNEESAQLNPGDACLQPHGVQHSTFTLRAGMFVEFAMPAPQHANPEATWLKASQAQVSNVVEWLDIGKLLSATVETAALAPADASRYAVHTFALPGYPLLETRLAKGTVMLPRSEGSDQLFYVVKGAMHAVLADTAVDVVTGDSMRSLAGRDYSFTALEDTVFIQTVIRADAG